MTELTTPFSDLIAEAKALAKERNPLPLFDDVGADVLSSEYRFTGSVQTLLLMSRMTEKLATLHRRACSLYAGFQRLSSFAEHLPRYVRLAQVAKEVYVIGLPDEEIKSWAANVHIVTRNAEAVAHNWFSVVTSKKLSLALLAEEREAPGGRPHYHGFYTNSSAVAHRAVEILRHLGLIGQTTLFEV